MKVTKILAAATVAALAAGTVAATASAYNAYLGFQTTVWSFRNAWDDATYGAHTDYFDSVIAWPVGEALDQSYPDYADSFDWDIEAYVLDANFTDAAIETDGTYTVSVDGFDWAVDGADGFPSVTVSTDLPFASFDAENGGTAKVTTMKIIVDGVEQASFENPPIEGTDYLKINAINQWNTDCPTYTGAYPTESLALEFTIEGLAAADAGDAGDTGSDATVDTGAGATDGGDKGSADTGVEGVAAVAGLAVVAGGALLLSKKRK